ncbi:MAG: hypothetical protein RIC56_03020 [Pseudomonadales bacterium]
MLTDIFAYRYADVPIWERFDERDRRFIVQAFRIVTEQLYPPYTNGKTNEPAQMKWKVIHDRLSTELGVHELSPRAYSYPTTVGGNTHTHRGTWSWDYVCKQYVCKDFDASCDPDTFMKNRLSFFEIAFRERGDEVEEANRTLPATVLGWKQRVASKRRDYRDDGSPTVFETSNRKLNEDFRAAVDELNSRIRQAQYDLNYHNGLIQVASDPVVEREVETPFWILVDDSKWSNVDTDMKEAVDLRDSGGRDPAWYAARALESAIKIISGDKGWTRGTEKGASHYIDNLVSKSNGRFIEVWEADSLKHFFGNVRADLGHGPGAEPMPELTQQQTNWAIQFCMSWIRSLIERS